MTRLKTILNKYKETRMAKPKFRLDLKTDKLYQIAKKAGEGKVDMVNNPPHYTRGGLETIDILEAKSTPEEFKGHLKLTAMTYITRAGHKDSELQDAKKTQWYVNRWVKTIEKETVRVDTETDDLIKNWHK
jgi:hypothetical protein